VALTENHSYTVIFYFVNQPELPGKTMAPMAAAYSYFRAFGLPAPSKGGLAVSFISFYNLANTCSFSVCHS